MKTYPKKLGSSHSSGPAFESAPEPAHIFNVHGIWAFGVHLMRSINFASKAFVISLLFLLPMALLGYFLVTTQYDQIKFSAKERTGVAAFRQFLPIYTGVLKTRNATLGNFDGRSQYLS